MPNPQYIQQAKKVRMYYDPRGQVVRTVNPDSTEQWVVFGKPGNVTTLTTNELGLPKPNNETNGGPTPWESYSYDANDLGGRTHPVESAGSSGHWNTPSSSLLDPLGRTIKTVDRNGSQTADEVVMQYEFDIRGDLKKVTDALGRTAFTHVYDLKPKGESEEDKGANILKTTHIDSGTKTAMFDAAYRPTELRDAKGALILHGYDELNRPTRIWARDNDSEDVTLRQELIYGDDATNGPSTPTDTNHLGKLYQHYDEAGKVTMDGYDFKGNVLQKKREVIADSDILAVFTGPPTDWEVPTYRVDWEGTPTLEGEFVTDMEYDGLNRIKKMVYPEDQDSERKELLPFYNNAGALEKVTMDGDTYVEHIAYNAKGQRLLIAFGNDVMTRYAYDPSTFRLARQRSETFTRTAWQFEGAGTVHQDTGYDYDLSGNILRIKERVTNCGVGGSNSLDRNFSYDPLYRLLSATGRENSPTITPIWDDSYRSTDHSITTAYNQNYQYDRMGNILQLQHIGSNSFTRNFSYNSATHNKLQSIAIGGDTYSFTYDANGNRIQENTDRHFEWDFSDKLRSFRVQAGTSQPTKFAHYLYDAGGNRVKKLVRVSGGNYTSTTYIDGIFELFTDGTDIQNTLHVMDDKSRIATVRLGYDFGETTPAIKYVLENHIGSSNVEIDDNGTSVEKEEYYPFGETSFASYAKKRFKYCGKERDNESGLYFYGARYYSAWTCRFISVDPLAGRYKHLTPYQNAANDPIGDYDIDGMQAASTPPDNAGDKKVTVVPADANGMPTIMLPEVKVTAVNGAWNKRAQQIIALGGPIARGMQSRIDKGERGFELGGIKWGKGLNPEQQKAHDNFMAGLDAMAVPLLVTMGVAAGAGVVSGMVSISPSAIATAMKGLAVETGVDIFFELGLGVDLPVSPVDLIESQVKKKLVREVTEEATEQVGASLLQGALKSNFQRFVKDMPVNAKDSAKWTQLEDGNFLFEATSPATNIPGSKAVYQKWVDPEGNTLKFIKTTYAPDGNIVHTKQKFP